MPVTLKKGHIFYKNNSGTYTGLDVITDKTTQQQIDLIQNAKGYIFTQADQFVENLKSSLPENFQTILENFSSTYSPSGTYAVGDYVIYNGSLYRCTTKITTAEAWTPAHWVQVSVGEDLSKAVWNEVQNLTVAQQSAARNNIQAADQMTVDFHSAQISDLETGKQDKLTFDSTPTAGSSNPVTSAGIKTVTDALVGDVGDLKSAFTNRTAGVLNSDSSADLDVADPNGNVLARFEGGEIKTKNFDSTVFKLKDDEEDGIDLDVTDAYGNAILRVEGGGVQTKQFKGFEYIKYSSDPVTYNRAACELKVTRKFHAGDRVTIHVERGLYPWKYGGVVTYKADDTVLFSGRGDNAYLEFTLFEDADEISAAYGAAATGVTSGDIMTLEVYLMGDIPIHPTIIKIKADGSGDYPNFRAALEAIGTNSDDVIHPYRFEVYPGTYDILADYTQEEIEAAEYSDTGFVGLKLINGMSMIGIGDRDKIVLTATMDTDAYDATTRNKVSTLNLQGSVTVENLTVVARNLRYTVHDDFNASLAKPIKRIIRNCVFEGYGAMTYPYPTTWGGGTPEAGAEVLFENCRFNGGIGIHTYHGTMVRHCPVIMRNCSAGSFSIGDIEINSDPSAITEFHLENCNIQSVSTYNWHLTPEQYTVSHVALYGYGGRIEIYGTMPFCHYETSDTESGRQDGTALTVGDVVKRALLTNGRAWNNCQTADMAEGVVITTDGDQYVVQKSGMVLCKRVGIMQCQLGDYIGVSNGRLAIVQSAEDAVGRVMYTTSENGFIKLNWRD